jgi:hypothetical protein
MPRISLDNPFLVKIAFLFFGLIGFLVVQIYSHSLNIFSIKFILLSFVELVFFLYMAYMLEKKQNWRIDSINPIFAYIVIFVKIYLIFLILKSGFATSFDDRLSVYGNSFLLGVSMATDFVLFPLLPLFGKTNFIKKVSFYLWIFATIIGTVLVPSKSAIIGIISNLLFYRFLKRKANISNDRAIPLVSLKSIFLFLSVIVATILFVISKVSNEGLYIVLYRVAYNFDIAIYASHISQNIYPEHSNLYYAILPLLKKIDPSLYNLEYFSIPQWVIGEYFGYSRYGRYGYPNDNLIVGLLLSYKTLGVLIFFLLIYFMYRYTRYFYRLKKVTLLHLILMFSIPGIFSSLQDNAIRLYTFIFIYIATLIVYAVLPKKINLT